MSLNKLPPEVARELLRHVKPRRAAVSATKQQSSSSSSSSSNNNNTNVLLGCVGFLGLSASIPYIATNWIGKNLYDSDEPLTSSQVRRGPFMNSGSRDAGPDPNWKQGQYVYTKEMVETLTQAKQQQDRVDLGPDVGPITRQQQSQQQKR